MSEKTSKSKTTSVLMIFCATSVAFLTVPLLLILYAFFVTYSFGWENGDASPGTFGDMFGGANALFSGWAFAGLLIALFMQRSELALQREELSRTREELSGQKEQLAKQSLEGKLFGMLRLLESHIDSISFTHTGGHGPERMAGSRALRLLVEAWDRDELKRPQETDRFGRVVGEGPLEPTGYNLCDQIDAFESFFTLRQDRLGPVVRLLFGALMLVEETDLPDEEKKRYGAIVKARTTSAELKLVLLFAQSDLGQNYKTLVNKYGLLCHLEETVKLANPQLVAQYEASAFK
ncbi:MAG: putative phage abortive infection protein [Sulfitobacter sp.]|uniref:putative phage abortive infection protein n=1 Tax=unclassified Sulfitobacter TaxID=196795 RepID=UPI002941ED48|nr:putative phage abortive infection protein [Sulfitobacter sp. LC.270.F.C4]WOI14526.1 putative phage abortive infection protein [Sulfitobacter sp. LC.270.F.C4]